MVPVKPSTSVASQQADPTTPSRQDSARPPPVSNGVDDFNFMRRVGVAMFLLGTSTLLATLPLPDPDTSDHTAIKIIAGLLALGAVVAWTTGTHHRRRVKIYVAYGILLVSALMAV